MHQGRTLRSDKGMFLAELMISMVIMAVVTLGLVTVILAQARQQARDKLLSDLNAYASIVMTEVETSFGNAMRVERSPNSGGRAIEELEFRFSGATNLGRTRDSRFTKEGERKVVVRHDGQRPDWVDRFPPPELDPDRYMDLNYRTRVKGFRVKSYQDRTFINPKIANILSEIELVLELEDVRSGFKTSQTYRRILCHPNKHIADNRQQSAVGA